MRERQRQWRALGIEVLVRRRSGSVAPRAVAAPADAAVAPSAARLRLWFAEGQAPQEAGLQRLLRDVLASLGLTPEQVGGDDANVPQLAFGDRAPEGAMAVASLARLRDPLEKRIAWLTLRRLRRRLRTGEA